ncbi:MAG: hypothetical protein ACSHWU_09750, partial [Marinicella sp.]
SDLALNGVCDTGNLVGSDAECTLRAAIQESNQFTAIKHIHFDIPAADCVGGSCVIDIDIINNGSLPDIIAPLLIDGTTQPGSETICDTAISDRGQYGIVVQGNSSDIGLRLVEGSDGSTIKGLNVRNFFNNIAIIDSDQNAIQCNFIGTNETGTAGSGSNTANGVIIGCQSNDNVIGGVFAADGNLIANQAIDGIQFYAGFPCSTADTLPSNNAVLGNYIGTQKDGMSPLGNEFSGISFFGGEAFDNYVGSLQDGTTLNPNIISTNSAGITIGDGSNNIHILGNYVGTDATGTANLGNTFGGVDIIQGYDIHIGGSNPGEGNLFSYNSEGVFITNNASSGNKIRGNSFINNLATAIEIVIAGDFDPDGLNPNDLDDADAGTNKLMNHPDVISTNLINVFGALFADVEFSVDATNLNATYPLQIDAYFDENENGQGEFFMAGAIYDTPQSTAIISFDIPDGVTGGYLRLTATDDEGNTSELSAPTLVGFIDLIFKDGFE